MRPPIPWVGGKATAASGLVAMFPPARLYIEPFLGAGSVFWELPNKAYEQIVLNDINSGLVNMWRCIRDRADEMMEKIEWTLHSREEFKDKILRQTGKKSCECNCHGDLERAVDFFVLVKMGHNSVPRSPGNWRSGKAEIKSLLNPKFDLAPYRDKLINVVIENRDALQLIREYDKPDAFVYLDPPYAIPNVKTLYQYVMDDAQHKELAEILKGLKGKFLMSYNDGPFIRDLYKDFNIMTAAWCYNSKAGKSESEDCPDGAELVITNFRVEDELPLFNQQVRNG